MAINARDLGGIITQKALASGFVNNARIVREAPTVTSPEPLERLAAFAQMVKALAKQHGWLARQTWQAKGADAGLECILIRERVITALLLLDDEPVPVWWTHWLKAWEQTGDGEAYIWRPKGLQDITTRLSHPWREAKHAPTP